MKRCLFYIIFVAPLIFTHTTYATVTADSVLWVPRATTPPVIDGKLDGIWHSVTNTFMEKHLSYMPEPENWFDLWGSFRVLWDDKNMYFFVHVIDDMIRTDGPNPWNDDSVDLFFDGNNSKTFKDYDGEDDVLMRFAYNFTSTDPLLNETNSKGDWFDPSNIIFKKLDTDYGWNLEISIPIEDLKIDAKPNYEFGFEIEINDNDSGQRDHGWKWSTGDNDTWRYANLLGTAILSDYVADSVLQVVPAPSTPIIDGQMDDIWKEIPEISHNKYVTHGEGAPVIPFDMRIMLNDWLDCSFTYRTMWDNNYIYFWITGYDNILSVPFTEGTQQNDSFELFFDGDNSKRSQAQGYDDNDMQIRFEWGDITIANLDGHNNPDKLLGIRYVQNKTEKGWVLEVAIPFSMLEIKNPTRGDVLGFEIQYNDNDTGERDAVARWFSENNECYMNASLFGTVKLVGTTSDIPLVSHAKPDETQLKTNYPNPFTSTTMIQIYLSSDAEVLLSIYDVLGHCVYVMNKHQQSGLCQIRWDGNDQSGNRLPSGIYFCRLQVEDFSETGKIILVR